MKILNIIFIQILSDLRITNAATDNKSQEIKYYEEPSTSIKENYSSSSDDFQYNITYKEIKKQKRCMPESYFKLSRFTKNVKETYAINNQDKLPRLGILALDSVSMWILPEKIYDKTTKRLPLDSTIPFEIDYHYLPEILGLMRCHEFKDYFYAVNYDGSDTYHYFAEAYLYHYDEDTGCRSNPEKGYVEVFAYKSPDDFFKIWHLRFQNVKGKKDIFTKKFKSETEIPAKGDYHIDKSEITFRDDLYRYCLRISRDPTRDLKCYLSYTNTEDLVFSYYPYTKDYYTFTKYKLNQTYIKADPEKCHKRLVIFKLSNTKCHGHDKIHKYTETRCKEKYLAYKEKNFRKY